MATEEWQEITRSRLDLMQVVLNSAGQYIERLEERNADKCPSY